MTYLYSPLDSKDTIHTRFNIYDSARDRVLDRARVHAQYVLPRLLESEHRGIAPGQEDFELTELFWHKPAENSVQLANKLTNAIFPPQGTPFFQFQISSAVSQLAKAGQIPPDAYDELLRAVTAVENEIQSDLQASNFRDTLYESLLKIIVLPDDLIYVDDDNKFRTYRLDQFVIRRSVNGDIVEIITRDWVEHDLLPEELKRIGKPKDSSNHFNRWEPLYTQLTRDIKTGNWKVVREFRDVQYEKAEYKKDAFPYFHMRWSNSTGEDYGTSLVEQVFGLIRSGEATAKSLVEGLAAGSQGLMGVSPTGVTSIDDVEGKPNWAWVSARPEDVFPIQPNTSTSVVTAQAALEKMGADLDSAFMSNASARLQGERVTAFQVDSLMNEQDESLGGLLNYVAAQVQRPVVLRMLAVKIKKNKVSPLVKEMLDKGYLTLHVKTGLDALGRQLDSLRLQAVGQTIGSLVPVFPEAAEFFNAGAWVVDTIRNSGLDTDRYAYTVASVQEKRQAAQQQAVAAAATQQAIQSAGSIAEQRLGNTQ